MAAIDKKGPNGISWLLFTFNNIKDIGKAIKADKKTDTSDNGKPKTKPNTASSLMSPPPIDSFLNKKSPNNFKSNINTKAANACNNDIPTDSIPFIKYLIKASIREKNINMLSGIIIVW